MTHKTALALLPLVCMAASTILLSGCGGQNSAPQNNGTVAPAAAPMTESQRETNALPLARMERVPRSLRCSGAVVWANPERKNYHMPNDPYYGRTRHGQYMCEETATAQGYHLAGMRRRHHGAAGYPMNDSNPTPEGP